MEAINIDKNCKTLWRHLKDLYSTTDHDIDMITYEDKNLTDKIDIINCLNDHFSSVGEKLIPHLHSSFESEKINNYVKSKINDNTLFSLYTVTNDYRIEPSKGCGPFRIYSDMSVSVDTTISNFPDRLKTAIDILTFYINDRVCVDNPMVSSA
ncbi:TMC [Mytilus coruscus]|uniref:TMC n=1 Tax=Mytilus coruscus TaxID=42192 RepID=A0A6J8DQR2_MYTCO|nr:TMC [Mytilus coruscus]